MPSVASELKKTKILRVIAELLDNRHSETVSLVTDESTDTAALHEFFAAQTERLYNDDQFRSESIYTIVKEGGFYDWNQDLKTCLEQYSESEGMFEEPDDEEDADRVSRIHRETEIILNEILSDKQVLEVLDKATLGIIRTLIKGSAMLDRIDAFAGVSNDTTASLALGGAASAAAAGAGAPARIENDEAGQQIDAEASDEKSESEIKQKTDESKKASQERTNARRGKAAEVVGALVASHIIEIVSNTVSDFKEWFKRKTKTEETPEYQKKYNKFLAELAKIEAVLSSTDASSAEVTTIIKIKLIEYCQEQEILGAVEDDIDSLDLSKQDSAESLKSCLETIFDAHKTKYELELKQKLEAIRQGQELAKKVEATSVISFNSKIRAVSLPDKISGIKSVANNQVTFCQFKTIFRQLVEANCEINRVDLQKQYQAFKANKAFTTQQWMQYFSESTTDVKWVSGLFAYVAEKLSHVEARESSYGLTHEQFNEQRLDTLMGGTKIEYGKILLALSGIYFKDEDQLTVEDLHNIKDTLIRLNFARIRVGGEHLPKDFHDKLTYNLSAIFATFKDDIVETRPAVTNALLLMLPFLMASIVNKTSPLVTPIAERGVSYAAQASYDVTLQTLIHVGTVLKNKFYECSTQVATAAIGTLAAGCVVNWRPLQRLMNGSSKADEQSPEVRKGAARRLAGPKPAQAS